MLKIPRHRNELDTRASEEAATAAQLAAIKKYRAAEFFRIENDPPGEYGKTAAEKLLLELETAEHTEGEHSFTAPNGRRVTVQISREYYALRY